MPGPADVAGAAEAEYRPLLFSIPYGMTGSVGDAEDIVQDGFVGLTRARRRDLRFRRRLVLAPVLIGGVHLSARAASAPTLVTSMG